MKKTFSIIIAISLLMQSGIHASEGEISGPETSKTIQEIHKAIEKIERDFKQALQQKKVIVAGSILVAIASFLLSLKIMKEGQGSRSVLPILGIMTSALTSALSSMIGILAASSLIIDIQDSQLDRIDRVLEIRTSFTSLKELSREQAILIIATYRRNIPMMKLLINHQPEFVTQTGVWKALTELYFNQKPTSGRIQRLKEMIEKASIPQLDISTSDKSLTV